jgi:hypothetical protein
MGYIVSLIDEPSFSKNSALCGSRLFLRLSETVNHRLTVFTMAHCIFYLPCALFLQVPHTCWLMQGILVETF